MDTNEVWARDDWPRDTFFAWFDRLLDQSEYRNEYQLAKAAGISHSAISNWRGGRQRPSTVSLRKLAGKLKVSEQEMLARAGDPNATISADAPAYLAGSYASHTQVSPLGDAQIELSAEERQVVALIQASSLTEESKRGLIAQKLEELRRAREERERQLQAQIALMEKA